jgi:type II secretory pathway pseudopilin PulG
MSFRPTAKAKKRARGSAGFALLEVLVAVGVAGVLMAMLIRAFSTTWGGIAIVREEAEGTLIARSILDELLMRPKLSPGAQEGTIGRYAWAVATTQQTVPTIQPPTDNNNEEKKSSTATILSIVVTTRGPSGRSNRLDAYKIGQQAAQ